MAEPDISSRSREKKGRCRRSKKSPTRVDLTPMVDLGFLLITFFMVATSWSRPRAMKIEMPAPGDPMPISEKLSLTILPLSGDRLFFYQGRLEEAMAQHRFGTTLFNEETGIGSVIRTAQADLDHDPRVKKGRKELFITIKPTRESSFGSVIRVMDEMAIHDVASYALTDPSEEELKTLQERKLGGQDFR